ncbi:protein-signal peptide and transmembrane prediction, partial [Candidatus Latescibacterota bacterium]
LERRYQVEDPADSGNFKVIEETQKVSADKVAIIICDMWNAHTCESAVLRVNELAPYMNEVLKTAHDKGVFIIHAPSETMEYYKDTPQRILAQNSKYTRPPVECKRNVENPDREPPLPSTLGNMGCACDKEIPCPEGSLPYPWTKENDAIEIFPGDAISDDGQEIYNMLEERGIDDVIIMGVHTNICVLRRSFGIRQMVYNGKNIMLCRDLTDPLQRDPGKHFEGIAHIVSHIEKYWCPSITSESITGKAPFRFKGDNTTGWM